MSFAEHTIALLLHFSSLVEVRGFLAHLIIWSPQEPNTRYASNVTTLKTERCEEQYLSHHTNLQIYNAKKKNSHPG